MTLKVHHKILAEGRWSTLSFAEQMGNIGGETSRARRAYGKDEEDLRGAMERAFELLDLTIQDPRWRKRLKELVRVREFLADAFLGGREYGTKLEDLDRYFLQFAFAARNR